MGRIKDNLDDPKEENTPIGSHSISNFYNHNNFKYVYFTIKLLNIIGKNKNFHLT